jgi:hypothetical protein
MMIPVNLEHQLVPGSLEFAIHYLVDNEIDLSGFEARFKNDEEGRPGYDLKIILKVVLLGYSRKIERACRENVTFMVPFKAVMDRHLWMISIKSSFMGLHLVRIRTMSM